MDKSDFFGVYIFTNTKFFLFSPSKETHTSFWLVFCLKRLLFIRSTDEPEFRQMNAKLFDAWIRGLCSRKQISQLLPSKSHADI